MSERLRLLILDRDYPDGVNLYSDVFVHVRVKEYAKRAEVLVVSAPNDNPPWEHEGIPVKTAPSVAGVPALIEGFRPHLILAHFMERPMIQAVLQGTRVPFIVWVHGYEGLGWYRRLFDIQGPLGLLRYARSNLRQLLAMRQLISASNRSGRSAFVFPSQWMRRAAATDNAITIRHGFVVPNPIEVDGFRYAPKDPETRRRVLLIRSFESRKYATDIAVDAICRFAPDRNFALFRFELYGRGRFFAEATRRLAPFGNVELFEHFVPHGELPALHARHGVLLCPTRQDTQGVTMCEGMSSGLVPITSRNTAIPEFVTDREDGFLTTSAAAIARCLEELDRRPEVFARMSQAAARTVRAKCELGAVIDREFEIIERLRGS